MSFLDCFFWRSFHCPLSWELASYTACIVSTTCLSTFSVTWYATFWENFMFHKSQDFSIDVIELVALSWTVDCSQSPSCSSRNGHGSLAWARRKIWCLMPWFSHLRCTVKSRLKWHTLVEVRLSLWVACHYTRLTIPQNKTKWFFSSWSL